MRVVTFPQSATDLPHASLFPQFVFATSGKGVSRALFLFQCACLNQVNMEERQVKSWTNTCIVELWTSWIKPDVSAGHFRDMAVFH